MYLRARDGSLVPKGYEVVLARQTINFRKELLWGETVDIGTAVDRLGNTSFTTIQGLFRGEDCVATAESVLVLMDAATRKPAILPDELRQKFK
jgi:acyl-CoA thioester hydrolase